MGRLRILCLHGFAQNASKFRGKTGALRRVLHKLADLDYVESAYQILPLSAPEGTVLSDVPHQLTWWYFSEESPEYRGWRDSARHVHDYIRQHGPFDGVLGFSQGAAMVAILCALQHQAEAGCIPFQFAILCGGFVARDPEIQHLFPHQIALPSLHIIGDVDERIPSQKSLDLAAKFHQPDIYRHDKGHLIPTNAPAAQRYRQFLARFSPDSSSL